MAIHAGDIYVLRGVPKPRPVIVVSREELNRGNTVVAVPLTTRRLRERWEAPSSVVMQQGEAGLDRECVAQAEAVSSVLVEDLDIEFGFVGALGEAKLDALVAAIGYVIAAECRRA